MSTHPPTWLVEAHKDARCPDPCPLCMRIEAYEPAVHEGRYYLTTFDYPEEL